MPSSLSAVAASERETMAAASDRDCDEEHDCRNGGIQQTPAFEAAACRGMVAAQAMDQRFVAVALRTTTDAAVL